MIQMWKKCSEVPLSKREIEQKIPDDSEYLVRKIFGLFKFYFEWKIVAEEDQYKLVESAYMPVYLYILFAAGLIGATTGFTAFSRSDPIYQLLYIIPILASIILLIGLGITFSGRKGPVYNIFLEYGESDSAFLIPLLTIVIAPFFLSVVFLRGAPQLVALFGVYVCTVLFYLFDSEILDLAYRRPSPMNDKFERLPITATNYIGAEIGLLTVPISLLILYNIDTFWLILDTYPVLFPILLSFLLLCGMTMLGYVSKRLWTSERSRFRRTGPNVTPNTSSTLVGITIIVASLTFGALSLYIISQSLSVLQRYETIGVYLLVFISILPIAYIGTGLLYQIYYIIRFLVKISINSKKEDLNSCLNVEAQTVVLETQHVFAGALTVFDDYIIVSEGLIEFLEDDELAAVLAHEESHLKNNEGYITIIVALISPIFLVGKNVVYEILDFRAREYRADRDAADRLSQQSVIDAIDRLQTVTASETADDLAGVTPTVVSFSPQRDNIGLLDQLFGLFFGDFAFSEAHPTLEERIERLKQ